MRNIIKAFFPIVLGAVFFCCSVYATVATYMLFQSHSKVFIQFTINHNYYDHDLTFKLAHQIDALNYVRKDLAKKGLIRDIPVIISMDNGMGDHTIPNTIQLSVDQKGGVSNGSEGDPKTYIGRSYLIRLPDYHPSYGEMVSLMIKLGDIKNDATTLEVTYIRELRASLDKKVSPYLDLMQDFDPIWSPDGRYLLHTMWKGGKIEFKFYDMKASHGTVLRPLKDYMMNRPVWSPNSEYVLFSSQNEICIYNARSDQKRTIDLPALIPGTRDEILMRFDADNNRVLFAGDTNAMDSYNIYSYDLADGRISTQEIGGLRPSWDAEVIDVNSRCFALGTFESPSGNYVAKIGEINGLKRINIRPSIKKEGFM